MEVKTILGKQELSKTDLVALLDCRDTTEAELFRHSRQLRDATIGNGVHMRGLIEISNVCIKDCLYCGIRKSNSQAQRYELNDEEIVEAAIFAYRNHYGSVVLQGGERHDPAFILRIERLVREIKHLSNQRLGITLSLGEQTEDTYRRWFDAGAHRYLLRIETSNESLYRKIHPAGQLHDFHTRLECIRSLQRCGYQTGTGVMIGLPFQTTGDLADDKYSPRYPMFFAQVSRKVGKFDIYVGCENIADYRQHDPILNADNPFSTGFNSMNVWGPLMGRKFYVGLRFNLY